MAGPIATDAIRALLKERYGDEPVPEPDREGIERGYVHWPADQSGKVDYEAILGDRGSQQEPGEGRLPTLGERAGGNWLLEQWLGQGDKMRAQAERAREAPLGTREQWLPALMQALMALPPPARMMATGSVRGSYPEPIEIPGLKHQPFQPTSDNNVFQGPLSALGAHTSRKGNLGGAELLAREPLPKVPGPYDEVLGRELEAPRGRSGGQQFFEPLPGVRIENPAEMSLERMISALRSGPVGPMGLGYTGAAELPAIASALRYLMQHPARGFGRGTSVVEELGRTNPASPAR